MIETRIPLRELIERDLGAPPVRGRQPKWRCPFHDDRNPSFTIMPNGRRCKCFGCDFRGDAIDYVKARYNLSHKDAVSYLGGSTSFSLPACPCRLSNKKKKQKPTPEQIRFAEHAEKIVSDCVDRLHSPQGARAFQWLRARGLRPEIIRHGRLGYNPKLRYPGGIKLERGITIPWMDGDRVQGIKIRLPGKDQKYTWATGQNKSGLYIPQLFPVS
jgi:DNA primase